MTRRRSRPSTENTLLAITVGLVIVAVIATAFILMLIINPDFVAQFVPAPTPTAPPTSTAFPGAERTNIATLPPTWTPSRTPPPLATSTPQNTTTPTVTPSITSTRVPTMTFTPINTPEVGWYEFGVFEAGFAVQFTNTWNGIPMVDRDANATLLDFQATQPNLGASILDGLGQARLEDLLLIAFDTVTVEDPHVTHMLVAYTEGDDIDGIHARNFGFYESNAFYDVIDTNSLTVDGEAARSIRYTTTYTGLAGESVTIYHLEVVTEQRRTTQDKLVITLSTSDELRDLYENRFDRFIGTLRFTG